MIQFKHTILYVENVERSMAFYSKVFGYSIKFITPEKDYGEVNSGNTVLSFAVHELAASNLSKGYKRSELTEKPFGIELGFITEDVEGLYTKAIENGAIALEKPIEKPWGQKVAYIRDLDGFLVEFGSPIPEQ